MMPSESVQPPSGLSKPNFSEKDAAEMVERIFGLKVSQVKPLPSYDDQNFHIHVAASEDGSKSPVEYVLKIINSEDSQNPELLEVQTRIMMFLHAEGFPVATPHCTKDGGVMYLERTGGGAAPRAYMVRLLSFLPGQVVAAFPTSPSLLFQIGQLAAKLDKTLAEKFQHPLAHSLHRGEFIWNLANVPLLEKYIHALDGGRDLEVVKQVIEQFRLTIVPHLGSFRPCINHGDFNDHNILVEIDPTSPESSQYRVSGILDFSDMSYGYYVFEAAIAIMYMMIESKDPLSVGAHVLAGFESIVPLTREERGALFLLVSGRFAQSLVMAAHTAQLHPENREYLMITAKTGWKHLRTLSEMGQEAVEKIWFEGAQTKV